MQASREIIGKIIAQRWRITNYLGEGKMSHVYQAQDEDTAKVITLKLIKSKLLNSVSDLDLLSQQTKSFIVLNQENIANYYDVHLEDNHLYLFCDYLSGESLATLLARTGKLPLEKCVELFEQIAIGLQYAHEKNICHGDLRPSNIFIVNDQFNTDEPKIVDFGIMRLIDSMTQNDQSHLSSTHPIFGAAPYMSPEQRMGKKIDERSDLYSLGCIMYEAICGKTPYSGKSAMESIYKQKYQTPTELEQLLPTHPLLLRYQLIINKLLRTSPKERYQSAVLLKEDLSLLLNAKESEWQKKANVLKVSRHKILLNYKWHLLLSIILIAVLLLILGFFISIIPYFEPWKYQGFDNSKLWLAQGSERPDKELLQQKDFLTAKLNEITSSTPKSSPVYANALLAFSKYLLSCKQFDEAQAKLGELQNIESTYHSINLADILTNISYCQYMKNDLDGAYLSANRVISLTQNDPKSSELKIAAYKILGDIYSKRNEITKAKRMYQQMYDLTKAFRLNHPKEYAYSSALLADIFRQENELNQAEQLYKEAIDWGENYIGHKQLFMAKALYGLALVNYEKNNFKTAYLELQQAIPIAIAQLGKDNEFVKNMKSLSNYLLFHNDFYSWYKARVQN